VTDNPSNLGNYVTADTHARHHGGQLRGRVGRPRGDPWLPDADATFSAISRESPVCSANVITGTSPAHDTRRSSSNTAEPTPNLCDTFTESAFLIWTD
jgi:hypothetical protein